MRRGGGLGRVTVAAVAALALVGCPRRMPPGPSGLRYTVKPGENLYRIGLAYGIPYGELARYNGIADPARIEVGRVVVIPGATRDLPVQVITPVRAKAERPAPPELPKGPMPFVWPVGTGTVSSVFGPRGETHHDGIDIQAPAGAPIHAVRAGRVLYSDELRGYGKIVILEHDGGYATVYAHNRVNAVAVGDVVRQGDLIAQVGDTGAADSPHLHFEVRQDNVARNPLFYLPRPSGTVRIAAGATAGSEGGT